MPRRTRSRVVIGDADGVADSLVCIQTDSKSGTTFAIADIAVGPNAGTYYATDTACSTTEATIAGWDTDSSVGW